jgi:hypothetical protein
MAAKKSAKKHGKHSSKKLTGRKSNLARSLTLAVKM